MSDGILEGREAYSSTRGDISSQPCESDETFSYSGSNSFKININLPIVNTSQDSGVNKEYGSPLV